MHVRVQYTYTRAMYKNVHKYVSIYFLMFCKQFLSKSVKIPPDSYTLLHGLVMFEQWWRQYDDASTLSSDFWLTLQRLCLKKRQQPFLIVVPVVIKVATL